MPKYLKYLILILSFIEGGAVMCLELCSAKLLAPYFGTSISIWAAVLGITLTALMSGYYLGGYLSFKYPKRQLIYWLMLIAGGLLTFSPILSSVVLSVTINMSLTAGAIVSLLCFMFLPLLLLGTTSPMIINVLTEEVEVSGRQSGTVYAVSTLGGIFTTFLVGFYTMPVWGISWSLYAYGALVILFSLILILIERKRQFSAAIVALFALSSVLFQSNTQAENVLYHSDGVMGEIKVIDRPLFNYDDHANRMYRELMVNNISQTIMDLENPERSYWHYVNVLMYNLKSYAEGENTLLLGMGGGTLYKQLLKENLAVDIVEIDPRIEKIAKKYFNVAPQTEVVVDDARHYIKTTDKEYDVIIYDLFHAETPPVHLMTKEAFSEIQERLSAKGVLIVNFFGFLSGDKGKAARSLYKTLEAAGFHIQIIATPGSESSRNLLFYCGKEALKPKLRLHDQLISKNQLDLSKAVELKDDLPVLEHLYLDAALSWRKDYNELNAKAFLKE